MIKSVFAAAAATALSMSAGAAIAGPYVNVETRPSSVGNDYIGTVTDAHVGYEGEVGSAKVYVQAGPAFVTPSGEDLTTRASGKMGIKVPVSDSLGFYGELKFLTANNGAIYENIFDDMSLKGKLGVKYTF